YPDVMVVRGEPEYHQERTDTINNPQLIIEVLSKSTSNYDRTDKFRAYRSIASFQEYLLLDQDKIYVEHFVKTDPKCWSFREYNQEDEAIALSSVEYQLTLTDIYNKVKL
ncbi:MAG: Uma2 family endonuclease, partial [Okeania sp. SIO2D1]|nr:Uma2 family endonuclease [Okeania sp. SIO2D1]